MANKGGLLSNLGQAVSGYASALSGNPLYLQNSLIMRQAQQQQAQQEQAQRQDQVANIATRSLMTGGSEMTPERKMGMLNLMAPQAMRSALAQQAISQIFPQGFTGTLGEGQVAYQNGKPVAVGQTKPADDFKIGTTRTVQRGGQNITEEYQGGGQWSAIGAGPAWKPDAPKDEKDTFGDQAKLRGEFDTKTKDFATTRDAYSRVVNVASNPSPAGDISLIFSFMKMNDPNSTVREGEYATAQNAGSVPQRVWGIYNKVLSGESLTPAQRADFVAQAGNLYGSQVSSFSQEYKRYSDLAQKYGFSADRVVYDRTAGLPAAMPIPQAGGTANAATPAAAPRAINPVTGETVEWNGTEWAKVK